MQQRTSYEDLLNQLTQNIENFPVDEKTQKRQHEFAPDVKQEIKENFGQLVFPCYAIYRAIGVRPDKSEIKKVHGCRHGSYNRKKGTEGCNSETWKLSLLPLYYVFQGRFQGKLRVYK